MENTTQVIKYAFSFSHSDTFFCPLDTHMTAGMATWNKKFACT